MTEGQRLSKLEREHSDLTRRFAMLSDQIGHALEALRFQAQQLIPAAQAQCSCANGWMASRNSEELMRKHRDDLEVARARLESDVSSLQREIAELRSAAVLDPSNEGDGHG